ncbi:hypothetical protein H4R23_003142 [Coemansia sp. Cherry 401B]|nr:hypothetical protein IWW52_005185 [Coemansia sp. RSA 2704]KAJ2731171.1 hypothetical protein H4R23_003142 [Coemansia sp. Cherry 401B]
MPAAKTTNHNAIQRLQDLLAPITAQTSTETPQQGRALTREPLEFICRTDKSTTPVSFAFSRQVARSPAQLQAQRARDLLQLCTALGITIDSAVREEIERAAAKNSAPASAVDAILKLRRRRAQEARMNYTRGAAADPYAELRSRLRDTVGSRGMGEQVRPQLDRRNVYFAANVEPRLYEKVVRHIDNWLPRLDYSRWCTLPVMVVNARADVNRYPGFVVIPIEFTLPELEQYLNENLDEIFRVRGEKNARAPGQSV